MGKKNLVRSSLKENMDIDQKGELYGSMDPSFEDMIEIIDRTANKPFSPNDLRNLLDWFIEESVSPETIIPLIRYLAGVHKEIQKNIIDKKGPYMELLDAFFEIMAELQNERSPKTPGLRGIPPISLN